MRHDSVPSFLDEHRITHGTYATEKGSGLTGAFLLPYVSVHPNKQYSQDAIQVIADDGRKSAEKPGSGWEHVSASVLHPDGGNSTPRWIIMCRIKELFWRPDETVVQYHPSKEEYVDMHSDVLHLWRPINDSLPSPPSELV